MATATVALDDSRRQRRGQIYVALAALAWSSAGVLQRQLSLDTVTQLAGRAAEHGSLEFALDVMKAYEAALRSGGQRVAID